MPELQGPKWSSKLGLKGSHPRVFMKSNTKHASRQVSSPAPHSICLITNVWINTNSSLINQMTIKEWLHEFLRKIRVPRDLNSAGILKTESSVV
jgi:hypothetical protein